MLDYLKLYYIISDQKNVMNPENIQLNKCKTHQQCWSFLMSTKHKLRTQTQEYSSADCLTDSGKEYEGNVEELHHPEKMNNATPSYVFPCINDALTWTVSSRDSNFNANHHSMYTQRPKKMLEADNLHVLVTGSLHLIGGVLALIDPELNSSSQNSGFTVTQRKLAQF